MLLANGACWRGETACNPAAWTPQVSNPRSKAALCTAPSIPSANPLTTTTPGGKLRTKLWVQRKPFWLHRRVPTTASTFLLFQVGVPRVKSTNGASLHWRKRSGKAS